MCYHSTRPIGAPTPPPSGPIGITRVSQSAGADFGTCTLTAPCATIGFARTQSLGALAVVLMLYAQAYGHNHGSWAGTKPQPGPCRNVVGRDAQAAVRPPLTCPSDLHPPSAWHNADQPVPPPLPHAGRLEICSSSAVRERKLQNSFEDGSYHSVRSGLVHGSRGRVLELLRVSTATP
jgi:hypothetical protein